MNLKQDQDSDKKRIAFIGPREYNLSLSFLGIECFGTKDKEELLTLIKKLKEDNFNLIFTTQDLLEDDIPGVVVLPGLVKKIDQNYLKKEITKAIGSEIFLPKN